MNFYPFYLHNRYISLDILSLISARQLKKSSQLCSAAKHFTIPLHVSTTETRLTHCIGVADLFMRASRIDKTLFDGHVDVQRNVEWAIVSSEFNAIMIHEFIYE